MQLNCFLEHPAVTTMYLQLYYIAMPVSDILTSCSIVLCEC